MKLYRIVHKNLINHMKGILWPENKMLHFLFASEIYHCSTLLKIERKSEKYLEEARIFIYIIFPLK